MASNFLKLVGERIRYLRKKKGLTQEALAEKAGIHYSYMSGIENADRNISMETLEKIIAALDVAPMEMFQFHELELEEGRAEAAEALSAVHSLLAGRSAAEILTVLRVAKEIFAAIDAVKK
ncbi:helix-turn-helix domain-containing protein [Paenibacillus sp. y28]|uniref:helix-turn-helix domain-containing protein n=1 Tax=Paenibacillus sp. y28 TaxID=3129110 RepID=UPI00301B1547